MSFLSGFSFGNNNEDEQKQQQAQAAPVRSGNPIAGSGGIGIGRDMAADREYSGSTNAKTNKTNSLNLMENQAMTKEQNFVTAQNWEEAEAYLHPEEQKQIQKPIEIKPEPVEAPEPEQVQAKTEKPEISKPEAIPEPVTETVPEVKPVETQQVVTTNAGALASGQNEKKTETPLSMVNAAEEDLKKNKGSVISGGNGVISNPIGQSGAAYRAPNHGRLTPVKAPNSELSTALGNFSQAQGQNGNPLGSVPTATGNQRYYTGVQSDKTGTGLARDLNQVLYGNPLGREGHRVTEEERDAMQIAENRFNPNPNATRFDLRGTQESGAAAENMQSQQSSAQQSFGNPIVPNRGNQSAADRSTAWENAYQNYKSMGMDAVDAATAADHLSADYAMEGNRALNDSETRRVAGSETGDYRFVSESVPAVDASGKPNEILNSILKNSYNTDQMIQGGMPSANAILGLFDGADGFKGVNIQGSFSDLIAPSTNRAIYQSNVNQDRQHTQTVKLTREQYKQKFQAFVDANPAIDKLLEAGKITEEDVMLHFFKNVEIVNNSGSYGGYRYTPRTYYSRGGGGGGYSGYRSGGGGGNNNYSQAYNQNPLTVSRVFNVMKNWEF